MLVVFVYISSRFSAIHSPNVRRNMKRHKSPINLLFWVSRLFKVADLGVDWKDLRDFLQQINSDLGPISRYF